MHNVQWPTYMLANNPRAFPGAEKGSQYVLDVSGRPALFNIIGKYVRGNRDATGPYFSMNRSGGVCIHIFYCLGNLSCFHRLLN